MLLQLLLAFTALTASLAFHLPTGPITARQACEIMHDAHQYHLIPQLKIDTPYSGETLVQFDGIMQEMGYQPTLEYLENIWDQWTFVLGVVAESEEETNCLVVHNFLLDWVARTVGTEAFERMVTESLNALRDAPPQAPIHVEDNYLVLNAFGYEMTIGLHHMANFAFEENQSVLEILLAIFFFSLIDIMDSVLHIEG